MVQVNLRVYGFDEIIEAETVADVKRAVDARYAALTVQERRDYDRESRIALAYLASASKVPGIVPRLRPGRIYPNRLPKSEG